MFILVPVSLSQSKIRVLGGGSMFVCEKSPYLIVKLWILLPFSRRRCPVMCLTTGVETVTRV